MSSDKKCLCKFDGQLYFCAASKWKDQQFCTFGLEAPYIGECVFYNRGYEGRCEKREANKEARENYQP